MRISAPDNTVYYGPKMDRIDTVYGRKYPAFTTFTVRFRIVNDAVLIDLGAVKITNIPRFITEENLEFAFNKFFDSSARFS